MGATDMLSILCVVGARPNFMKIAPLMRRFNSANSGISATLLHTGQHYDEAMKQSFFDQLDIPTPDIDLGVGGGSHAVQTAEIMKRFEPVVDEINPDIVLVVGDVNSTVACALVAAKKNIKIVHVEAGLRSFDRAMPEEINRLITDQLSDLLFTTEKDAVVNLNAEGIASEKVHFVGNVMIDTLLNNLDRAVCSKAIFTAASATITNGYGLVTLHRPSNVDEKSVLEGIVETLVNISEELPLAFPVHPRTKSKLEEFNLLTSLSTSNVLLLPPMAYLDMLGLMRDAKVVLTDSGGLQEETTALGVACITLRENTERPITITEGTNVLVGSKPSAIYDSFREIMDSGGKSGNIPKFWDGKAAERIHQTLLTHFCEH
jgi:UDP-N-acetylglucosamine 2-epimerase (non-hydrolysing)